MASRKSVKKAKKNFVAKAIITGALVCVVAGIIGFASMTMRTPDQVSMGLGSASALEANISIDEKYAAGAPASSVASASSASASSSSDASSPVASDASTSATDVFASALTKRSALNELTPLNASADLNTLNNRIEQRKRAEEEARRIAEENHIREVQEKQSAWGGNAALSDVDFSVGEEAFVQEWTQRIDDYLAGSALAGCGCDFAQAAWDYGVDPRWSPAISNTESGKGSHCFLPHNAWGWGASIWFNWTDAIYDHVKGLADGYGYSITYAAASAYCPPNTSNWYNNTLGEMQKI